VTSAVGLERQSGVPANTTILVVEEQFVSEFLRTVLIHRGYQVICTRPGNARALLRHDRASVHVLVTNVPLDFAAFPDLPVLYVAASPDPEVACGFEHCVSLRKPFQARQLYDCIEQLLP
jgi:hypothetical protein